MAVEEEGLRALVGKRDGDLGREKRLASCIGE